MTHDDMIEQVLHDLNASPFKTMDPTLNTVAQELAEGVTAEREAEIAAALPAPYARRVPARAQIDGDYLTVPRAAIISANLIDGVFTSSARGRKLRAPKRECAVGFHTEVTGDWGSIFRIVVLWRRDK